MTASSVLPGLMLLVGSLAGIGATWVATKRRSSGNIATSEAADVWQGQRDLFAASESIRHDLTARVAVLQASNAILETDNDSLRDENHVLREELARRRREHD